MDLLTVAEIAVSIAALYYAVKYIQKRRDAKKLEGTPGGGRPTNPSDPRPRPK